MAALAALAALACAVGPAVAATDAVYPLLEWVEYTFHAGHVCEGTGARTGGKGQGVAGAVCRSYAHTVMFVAPPDVTSEVVGGASYRIDGGPVILGGPATFERHLVESDGNATIQKLPKG